MRTEGCRDVGWKEASLCCSAEDKTAVALQHKLPVCLAWAFSNSSCGQLFTQSLTFCQHFIWAQIFLNAIQGPLMCLERIFYPLCVWFSSGAAVQPHFSGGLGQDSHGLTKPGAGILAHFVPRPGGHRDSPCGCLHPCPSHHNAHPSTCIPPTTAPLPTDSISHFLCQGNVSQVILCFHSSKARII